MVIRRKYQKEQELTQEELALHQIDCCEGIQTQDKTEEKVLKKLSKEIPLY